MNDNEIRIIKGVLSQVGLAGLWISGLGLGLLLTSVIDEPVLSAKDSYKIFSAGAHTFFVASSASFFIESRVSNNILNATVLGLYSLKLIQGAHRNFSSFVYENPIWLLIGCMIWDYSYKFMMHERILRQQGLLRLPRQQISRSLFQKVFLGAGFFMLFASKFVPPSMSTLFVYTAIDCFFVAQLKTPLRRAFGALITGLYTVGLFKALHHNDEDLSWANVTGLETVAATLGLYCRPNRWR